jgi:hypothetical protein
LGMKTLDSDGADRDASEHRQRDCELCFHDFPPCLS